MKAYRASYDWDNEEYPYFERVHSKNKARKVAEKRANATGRELAKMSRELARKDKEVRLGIPVEPELLVCNEPASSYFEPPYAA